VRYHERAPEINDVFQPWIVLKGDWQRHQRPRPLDLAAGDGHTAHLELLALVDGLAAPDLNPEKCLFFAERMRCVLNRLENLPHAKFP
jgi:hypothetical protein